MCWGAHLELAALEAGHGFERGLDGVPLEAVEEVPPVALQVAVHALVQEHLQILYVHWIALWIHKAVTLSIQGHLQEKQTPFRFNA